MAKSQTIRNLEAGRAQHIVTYGTSLTDGARWVDELRETLVRRYPGLVTVTNSGCGAQWSTWGAENLDERVIAKKPDTVFIEFGINDAFLPYETTVEQARSNVNNMIDRILAANPQAEIILMVMNPPLGEHLEKRPRIEEYYAMYRDVAKCRKLMLIDHYPAWVKLLREDKATFDLYIPDGIHPAPLGCERVITPRILEALGYR